MKMEQTGCSETSAYKIQTPGNYPEENIQLLRLNYFNFSGVQKYSRCKRSKVCVIEHCRLLGCYTASLGQRLPAFQKKKNFYRNCQESDGQSHVCKICNLRHTISNTNMAVARTSEVRAKLA